MHDATYCIIFFFCRNGSTLIEFADISYVRFTWTKTTQKIRSVTISALTYVLSGSVICVMKLYAIRGLFIVPNDCFSVRRSMTQKVRGQPSSSFHVCMAAWCGHVLCSVCNLLSSMKPIVSTASIVEKTKKTGSSESLLFNSSKEKKRWVDGKK